MDSETWQEGNSRYLSASLRWLRVLLERAARQNGALAPPPPAPATPAMPTVTETPQDRGGVFQRWRRRSEEGAAPPPPQMLLPEANLDDEVNRLAAEREEAAQMEPPPALVMLSDVLGLSEFEREVLLLCVASELDTGHAGWCASAQGDRSLTYPTFALALSLFDAPSWDALSPHRPLRYWQLVELSRPPGLPLTASPLRADERIVSYVKGLNSLDDRLVTLLTPAETAAVAAAPYSLAPSQHEAAGRILWNWRFSQATVALPAAELLGPDPASKKLVALEAASALGRQLFFVSAEAFTAQAAELELLGRLWQRETLLLPLALYVDAHDAAPPDRLVTRVARSNGLLMFGVRDPLPSLGEASFTVDVGKPNVAEQEAAWRDSLGEDATTDDDGGDATGDATTTTTSSSTSDAAAPEASAESSADAETGAAGAGDAESLVEPDSAGQLAAQFSFNLPDIRAIAASARAASEAAAAAGAEPPEDVWELCKARTRQHLDVLAERLEPKATWDDLVVGEEPARLLRAIANQVRHRNTVYERWGFSRKMSRGFGISALFAGESGTGKTMAAEVIANDLRLNLYRIDLSGVVSKYIGETEKNLRRLFDAAENGGAILFFDEADALFGKRSEVKDSHDRYANIEINYLLQRMEAFGGLAILATNMKSALDQAFMRRLRFVVNFSFPGVEERKQMWLKAFPAEAPTAELDFDRLAKLSLTGGHIHNIALNAAFLAAQAGSHVTMPLVMSAARSELRKLDRALNEADFRV